VSAADQTAAAHTGRHLLAWYGVLGGPIAWAVELLAGYGTQETACSIGSGSSSLSGNAGTTIGVLTIAMLLVALGSWIAVRSTLSALHAHAIADPRGRVLFMAQVGAVSSLLFALAIVLSGIPILTLDSCHT
jgi:hypothetical protein